MSIATLKRKTEKGGNPRVDPVSGIGAKGFSLNGGHRNIGAVGQFRMVSNVTRTPFRGTEPMGHGGFDGEYYNHPSNSGDCCANDNSIIKHSSLNTAGMLDEKYKWTKSQYPNYWVKDDNNSYHHQNARTADKSQDVGVRRVQFREGGQRRPGQRLEVQEQMRVLDRRQEEVPVLSLLEMVEYNQGAIPRCLHHGRWRGSSEPIADAGMHAALPHDADRQRV